MGKYQKHVEKWSGCTACPLHEQRKRMVFSRGKIKPCHVLFIGEAPGLSEDVLGVPFIGPAGDLLDWMIKQARFEEEGTRYAITNLLCCVPKDEDGFKVHEPGKAEVDACSERLAEFVDICAPEDIVAVGSAAAKYLKVMGYTTTNIIHPAAILRMDSSQKDLAIQRTIITLEGLI